MAAAETFNTNGETGVGECDRAEEQKLVIEKYCLRD